jgi:hypothetical protein
MTNVDVTSESSPIDEDEEEELLTTPSAIDERKERQR